MKLADIHYLTSWAPARPTFEEEIAAMRLDIEDLAAGIHDNHQALIGLERSVDALKANNAEILTILKRGAR